MYDFMNGNFTTFKTYTRSVLEKEAEKVCAAKDFKECDAALFDMIQQLHKLRKTCAKAACNIEFAKKYQTESKDDNWPVPVELGTEVRIYVDYTNPVPNMQCARYRLQYTDQNSITQNVYLEGVTRTCTSACCDTTYLELETVDKIKYGFRKEDSCNMWRFIKYSRPIPWMADTD